MGVLGDLERKKGQANVVVEETNESVVSGFYCQDGTGYGNISGVGDVGSSTEVSGDTCERRKVRKSDEKRRKTKIRLAYVLNNLGETEEGRDVGVGEGVLAASRRVLDPCSLQCGGEESDVGSFIGGNLLEDGVESSVTGVGEGLFIELGEGLRVEDVLEVLEDEGELEDGSIIGCRRSQESATVIPSDNDRRRATYLLE